MEISIESVESKFDQHLNLPQNNRILFSGKFGTGKSYFLKKYFENRKDNYNLFWLSPVNYVVGANQDIFEWIKIDIAKELTSKDLFSKNDQKLSKNFLIQTHIYQNAPALFTELLAIVGNAVVKAKTGFDDLGLFKKQIDNYKEFEAEAKEEVKSDFEKISKYIKDSFQVKGSIYEDDLTTQILRASISLLKYKTNKENVLVIDDLDRLDPEHIFRILNILSAHNDHFDTNKFGFDKVILVCDKENIQNIYKYKYGIDVDFDGYIEKFFTYEPYYFSIGDAVEYYCSKNVSFSDIDNDSLNTLKYLLILFYNNEKLRIRNIKKILSTPDLGNHFITKCKKYDIKRYPQQNIQLFKQIINTDIIEVDFNEYGILKVLFILSNAFGDIYKLRDNINLLIAKTNYPIDENYIQSIINSVATIYHISINNDYIENCFFHVFDDRHGKRIADYPNVNFLNIYYQIHFGWGPDQKYSNGDYFKHSRVLHDRERRTNNATNRINNLLECLNTIINFIIKENLFSNLRQTSLYK